MVPESFYNDAIKSGKYISNVLPIQLRYLLSEQGNKLVVHCGDGSLFVKFRTTSESICER